MEVQDLAIIPVASDADYKARPSFERGWTARQFGRARTKKLGTLKRVVKVRVYAIFEVFACFGRRTKGDFKDWGSLSLF